NQCFPSPRSRSMESMFAFALACLTSQVSPVAPRAPTSSIHLPLTFVENRGQLDERARFYASAGGVNTYFTRDSFVMQLTHRENEPMLDRDPLARPKRNAPAVSRDVVFLEFEGASSHV